MLGAAMWAIKGRYRLRAGSLLANVRTSFAVNRVGAYLASRCTMGFTVPQLRQLGHNQIKLWPLKPHFPAGMRLLLEPLKRQASSGAAAPSRSISSVA